MDKPLTIIIKRSILSEVDGGQIPGLGGLAFGLPGVLGVPYTVFSPKQIKLYFAVNQR